MSRAALVAAIALTLAACSTGEDPTTASGHDHRDDALATYVTVSDAWIKAADNGMTAAFGTLTNTSDHDVTVTGAHSDAAQELQLHEVVDSMMREVGSGLVVPAGETLTLEPGGYHIMFMEVSSPIEAGDEVAVVLEFEDGSELTFTAIAKDFAGGNEEYDGGMEMSSPSPGMDG